VDDGGNDGAALDPTPVIEVQFGGLAARLRIPALTPPELAAALVRALRFRRHRWAPASQPANRG
jgi:hypothetical protein